MGTSTIDIRRKMKHMVKKNCTATKNAEIYKDKNKSELQEITTRKLLVHN